MIVAIANFKMSEWQLARQLYAKLTAEDVVVVDSAYGTYADLALVQQLGADGVFRKHHAQCDFRRGKRLGKDDHLLQWQRPSRCPAAMSPEEFAALPLALRAGSGFPLATVLTGHPTTVQSLPS